MKTRDRVAGALKRTRELLRKQKALYRDLLENHDEDAVLAQHAKYWLLIRLEDEEAPHLVPVVEGVWLHDGDHAFRVHSDNGWSRVAFLHRAVPGGIHVRCFVARDHGKGDAFTEGDYPQKPYGEWLIDPLDEWREINANGVKVILGAFQSTNAARQSYAFHEEDRDGTQLVRYVTLKHLIGERLLT